MLHFPGGECLGVDVADFLKFQAALQRHGIIQPAPDEKGVLGAGVLAGKPLDAFLVCQGLGNFIGQGFQLGDQMLVLPFRQGAAHAGKLGCQQVASCQLGAVCLGGGNGNFRTCPSVQGGVGLARNAGADHVDNAHRAHAALLAKAQGCQRVGGFAALADDQGKGVWLQHRVAVAEFAGDIHLDRNPGKAFQHIARCHTHMVGGAAADDIDAAHSAQIFLGQRKLRKVDFAVLQARRKRIAHGGGLLVDLLHHKMLVAALFGSLGIPFHGGHLAGDGFFVDVEKFDLARAEAGNLQIVNVVDIAGVLEQCGYIGGDDGAVLAATDDQRAVLAHGVNDAGLVGKQDAQGVRAAHAHHRAGDSIQRVPGGIPGVVVVEQLRHDLGVGLGGKGKALVH